jgi:uncharacterized protein
MRQRGCVLTATACRVDGVRGPLARESGARIGVGARRIARAVNAGLMVLTVGAAFAPIPARTAESAVLAPAETSRVTSGVTSLRALRDAGVVRQRYDYSCGAAALATILTYGLHDVVDEEWLLRALLAPLADNELAALHRKGLSLLELQALARQRGHQAQAFRLSVDQLAKLSRPVIVFVRPGGHNHFAVLKAVRGDRVYLADPSLGNVRMPLYRFRDMWADPSGRGVVFAVEPGDGRWPETSALTVKAAVTPAIEWSAFERLSTTAIPLPSISPNR